ncbi:pirin family protein [Crocosphaera watsonii]|uniref:Pirin n=1 Tax=Crocosphaera watsonii WH 8502 TaxID=423474 RepID=T2IMM8_CROWT|nr:pirin family protein [Crocosphaera watsonii]CCQ53430.1 Pirin [Crocosphaera watsonii WH 8502]
MITVRPSQARGHANFGWLDSKHTFSFGSYYDPNYLGFGNLRVINEDRVKAGQGFGPHGHRDMEIITYVLDGALEHRDSMGHGSVICPGDVQRISAGSGIAHSEFNASKTDSVHFLQIWILPNTKGLEPNYEEKHFTLAQKQGQLRLVASGDGRNDSIKIHQDVDLYAAVLKEGDRLNYAVNSNRSLWLQVARRSVTINGKTVNSGDGIAITQEPKNALIATSNDTEILLFDLA